MNASMGLASDAVASWLGIAGLTSFLSDHRAGSFVDGDGSLPEAGRKRNGASKRSKQIAGRPRAIESPRLIAPAWIIYSCYWNHHFRRRKGPAKRAHGV